MEVGLVSASLQRRLSRRWLIGLALVPLTALGIVVGIDRLFFSPSAVACHVSHSATSRPELQRILDGLVAGPAKLAPGATAYVSGPHGSWSGAAGVADTSTCAPMPTDARVRLESVSKIFTATLILQLDQAGRLHVTDTVARWLPGALPYGKRITIRQLLTMSSGLVDTNDFTNASERVSRTYVARIKDAKLRATLLATADLVTKNPAAVVSPRLWVEWAAWQPLLFSPGAGYHYSNIGYDVLGLIAARAGGKPLATLYRELIFTPLRLRATSYDPQGPISGSHAHGYGVAPNGTTVDTSDWHWGVGAGGGIVSNAQDTGAFLSALMRGTLLGRDELSGMKIENLWLGGTPSGCADQAYGWSGGGSGFKTDVWVDGDGGRVGVLLLNARHWDTAQPTADARAHAALAKLYCSA